jgi:hypothetical protein
MFRNLRGEFILPRTTSATPDRPLERAYPFVGELMKFKGKAITGSSLLMVLGVLCFATILVAAVVSISGSFTSTTTITNKPDITMTGPGDGNGYVDDAVTYTFSADVPVQTTDSQIQVTIAETGISSGMVTSAVVNFDGNAFPVTLTDNGDTLSGVVAIHSGALAAGTVAADTYSANSVVISYHVAGTYVVTVDMSGNTA